MGRFQKGFLSAKNAFNLFQASQLRSVKAKNAGAMVNIAWLLDMVTTGGESHRFGLRGTAGLPCPAWLRQPWPPRPTGTTGTTGTSQERSQVENSDSVYVGQFLMDLKWLQRVFNEFRITQIPTPQLMDPTFTSCSWRVCKAAGTPETASWNRMEPQISYGACTKQKNTKNILPQKECAYCILL